MLRKLQMRLAVWLIGPKHSIVVSARLKRLLEIEDMTPEEFAMHKFKEACYININRDLFTPDEKKDVQIASLRTMVNQDK